MTSGLDSSHLILIERAKRHKQTAKPIGLVSRQALGLKWLKRIFVETITMTRFHMKWMPTLLAAIAPMLLLSQTASATLVAHFDFEDGTASATAADSSGNGHTGTFAGGAAIINDAERGLVYTGDGDGSHMDFASTVDIPDVPANGGVTLAAWIKLSQAELAASGTVGIGAILTLGRSGNNPLVIMSVTSDGSLGGYIDVLGGTDQTSFPGGGTNGKIVADTWTHVAITFDRVNDEARLYVDGVFDVSIDISGTSDGVMDWGTRADVGGYNTYTAGNTFKGLIDDARYYDEVLDATAVAALVPEPVSCVFLVIGTIGLAGFSRRRRRQRA